WSILGYLFVGEYDGSVLGGAGRVSNSKPMPYHLARPPLFDLTYVLQPFSERKWNVFQKELLEGTVGRGTGCLCRPPFPGCCRGGLHPRDTREGGHDCPFIPVLGSGDSRRGLQYVADSGSTFLRAQPHARTQCSCRRRVDITDHRRSRETADPGSGRPEQA